MLRATLHAALVAAALIPQGQAHAEEFEELSAEDVSPDGSAIGETLGDGVVDAATSGPTIVVEGRGQRAAPGTVVTRKEDAEETAGVQGDALKAVTTVGGVARSSGAGTGVSVWGAAPADTRIYVDNIPVPRLFHMGGSRSILPSGEIASFTVTPGGAPARFGRGIGGAITVETAEPSWQEMDMRARVDPIDVDGGFGARLGESGAVSFAARSSIIAPVFRAIAPPRADEAMVIPDYTDMQGRLTYVLGDGQELRVLGLVSADSLSRGIPRRVSSESLREVASSGFGRLGVSLEKTGPKRSRRLTLWVGRDDDRVTQRFSDSLAEERSRKTSLGLLLVRDARMSDDLELRLGVDSEVSRAHWSREGAISLPAREGDIAIFGQEPGNRVGRDAWSVSQASVGLFATATWALVKGLRVQPGLRLEPSMVSGDRVLPVRPSEPRVGYSELQWSLGPRARISYESFGGALTVFAAGGRYSQAPPSGDLSPVFGSPRLEQAEAWQGLFGVAIAPAKRLSLAVTGFTSKQEGLAVRAPSPTPAIASLLESTGEGRTRGLSVAASVTRGPLHTGASYTFLEADRRSPGLAWRPFDLEQKHTLRAAMRWRLSTSITVSARAELASGFPRTPVVGAVFNANSQAYDPIFGLHNSAQLPAFAELSVRASYQTDLAHGTARVWIDVVNATNRRNVLETYYSADYSQQSRIYGFPLLPLIGAELAL